MTKLSPVPEWNSERYAKYKAIAEKLTDKGIRIALNQASALHAEVVEAYEDTLRERGSL